jgi:hypothetical protein
MCNGGTLFVPSRRVFRRRLPRRRLGLRTRANSAARTALAEQAAAGDDPPRRREANRKSRAASSEHHRRNNGWAREHGDKGRDAAWFQREVVTKIAAHPLLNPIAEATGLSLTACSRIRAGSQIPHPRH